MSKDSISRLSSSHSSSAKVECAMAVVLEFIDFVVPVALIHKKYPGG